MKEKIERLLLKEFQTVPFHNLFMLNKLAKKPSHLGGTCSDKVLNFKSVLTKNGLKANLHSSFIKGKECHRMLSITIDCKKYFIDVGSGWASIKLFPAFVALEYTVYGSTFKTELLQNGINLYRKDNAEYKEIAAIPFESKSEKKILVDIKNRFSDTSIYPFQNNLRFSILKGEYFYFLKGNKLRIYTKKGFSEQILKDKEVYELIHNTFNFNLKGLKYDFF